MSNFLFYLYKKNHSSYNNCLQKLYYCSKIIKDANNTAKKKHVDTNKKEVSEKTKHAILKSVLTRDVKRINDHQTVVPGIQITALMEEGNVLLAKKDSPCEGNKQEEKTLPKDKASVTQTSGGSTRSKQKEKKNILKSGQTPGGTTRPIRLPPAEVYLGFIPKEWVTFFLPKTGASGLYTLFFTLGTYLVSKEYYVLEHNYYGGLSMAILMCLSTIYLGPRVGEWLDNDIKEIETAWNEGRESDKKSLRDQMKFENWAQWSVDGQLLVVDAKRENVHLQREEAFRIRQLHVYGKVLERLKYHSKVQEVHKKMVQKNLVEWELNEVHKALTTELKGEYLKKVLADIQKLTKKE